jgi:hypothetical protein
MTTLDPQISRLRFTFHGPIRLWDLAQRRLSLGGRELWLAPALLTSDLELGTEVVAKGYEAEPGEPWIVDHITVTRVDISRRRPRSLRGSRPRY